MRILILPWSCNVTREEQLGSTDLFYFCLSILPKEEDALQNPAGAAVNKSEKISDSSTSAKF
ncbi:hypothetical protein [Nonlabens sp.]|uniref:hypothetical protein n=1 Tax=Nonlabens sp. TaxID=1888209 RepID=UPI0025DAB48C|nr:hypothetical protein [Nonlabens sp.]